MNLNLLIRTSLITALVSIPTLSARAWEVQVENQLNSAKAAYVHSLGAFKDAVDDFLSAKEKKIRKKGDFQELMTFKVEKNDFARRGLFPKQLPRAVRDKYSRARSVMEDAYGAAKMKYVALSEDDAATAIDEEIKEFKTRDLAEPPIVRILATNERGYVIGRVHKGEKLVLQYISGKWKGWGMLPTESPDKNVFENNDRCRLVLCNKPAQDAPEVLKVIPQDTATTPFELTFDKDYQDCFLRINDTDGDFLTNPDDSVKYILQLLRDLGT